MDKNGLIILCVYLTQADHPSLMLAYRLAQVFNTSVEELCCLEENKRIEDREIMNNQEDII